MPSTSRSCETFQYQLDITDIPYIPDAYIEPADGVFSAEQFERMRTKSSDGDPIGLYGGHRKAQEALLTQENAAYRLATEKPWLLASLAGTAVTGYNND